VSAGAIPNFDDFVKSAAAPPGVPPAAAIPRFDDFVKAKPTPAASAPSGGFWSGLIDHLAPVASKLYTNITDPHLPTGEFLKTWQDQSQGLMDKAKASAAQGNYVDAASHGINLLANIVPGLGKAMDDAAEGIAAAKSDEEVRTVLGGLTGDVLPIAAANAVPGALRAAPAAGKVVGAAVKAGAPDIAMGGLKAAAGGALLKGATEMGLGGDVGGALITAPLIKAGLKQMGKGAKAGVNAGIDTAKALRESAARLRVPTPVPNIEAPPAGAGGAPLAAQGPGPAPAPVSAPVPAPIAAAPTPVSQLYDAAQGLLARNAAARSAAGGETLARPAAAPQGAPVAPQESPSGKAFRASYDARGAAPAAPAPAVTAIPPAKPDVPAQVFEDAARAKKTAPVAQLLHESGIAHADASGMDQAQWDQVARAAGVNPLSKISQADALFKLRKLELGIGPSPELLDALKKKGALAAAEALRDAQ
jgi:hypothetical protein